jgi:hypothetical protein
MAVLLGAMELFLLDHGLRKNVDDSLHSVARVIANSSQSRSFFGPDSEDSLQAMLGPELPERFFQLVDPLGRIDPRWTMPRRSGLPVSAQALRNAERGQPTFGNPRIGWRVSAPLASFERGCRGKPRVSPP